MAALEKGVGAIATASGQAALHLAIATLMGAGAHIVASRALYGGSHNLLAYTLARFGIETTFVDPRDLRRLERGDPPEHAAAVRRDARQSRPRRARHPGRRAHRARARRAAAGRLDLHHAVPDDAVRSRRRSRLPLGDQVPRRPRRRDRRRAGRRRHVRLARQRQIPDADRALRRLPRHELRRGKHGRAVPAARPARRPARLRRLHEPAHRVPAAAGARDAAAAHGSATSRTRARWSTFLATHPAVESVAYPELPSHPDHALAQRLLPRGCGAVFSFNLKGIARRRAHLRRGAARVLAPRQRRRRQVAGDPSGFDDALPRARRANSRQPASRRARSGCRSASRIRPT